VIEAAAVTQGESQRAAVMYGSPSLGSTSAERYLALTLSAARETLYITSAYFVPSGGFRAMLCKAAENGVDVRVLTPGRNTDQPSARYAGRVHYEELLRRGVRVYEYAPTMLHAKTIVADRVWASVGSINFDNRSLKLNDEVTLIAQDEGLGCAMQEMFLRDLTFAQEVVLNEFARAPSRDPPSGARRLVDCPVVMNVAACTPVSLARREDLNSRTMRSRPVRRSPAREPGMTNRPPSETAVNRRLGQVYFPRTR
jgi:phosphatidylserine/phosphatidylglycerophosphate/cardiolipin synthase-like enzyme